MWFVCCGAVSAPQCLCQESGWSVFVFKYARRQLVDALHTITHQHVNFSYFDSTPTLFKVSDELADCLFAHSCNCQSFELAPL